MKSMARQVSRLLDMVCGCGGYQIILLPHCFENASLQAQQGMGGAGKPLDSDTLLRYGAQGGPKRASSNRRLASDPCAHRHIRRQRALFARSADKTRSQKAQLCRRSGNNNLPNNNLRVGSCLAQLTSNGSDCPRLPCCYPQLIAFPNR